MPNISYIAFWPWDPCDYMGVVRSSQCVCVSESLWGATWRFQWSVVPCLVRNMNCIDEQSWCVFRATPSIWAHPTIEDEPCAGISTIMVWHSMWFNRTDSFCMIWWMVDKLDHNAHLSIHMFFKTLWCYLFQWWVDKLMWCWACHCCVPSLSHLSPLSLDHTTQTLGPEMAWDTRHLTVPWPCHFNIQKPWHTAIVITLW